MLARDSLPHLLVHEQLVCKATVCERHAEHNVVALQTLRSSAGLAACSLLCAAELDAAQQLIPKRQHQCVRAHLCVREMFQSMSMQRDVQTIDNLVAFSAIGHRDKHAHDRLPEGG